MRIDLVPDMLPHIYGAHKDGKLVIFVGAGISALWGSKRWKDMAVYLIEACYEYGCIDYWDRETLLSKYISSPRKLITIAKNRLNDKYLSALKSAIEIKPERKTKLPNLFSSLAALNAAFITTNIDDNLSSLFRKECVYSDPNKFSLSELKPKNLFHLHGVIHESSNLVLTIDEYVARYQNENVKNFLQNAFLEEKNCFLFVGYGVDEMEIIDYMIEKYSEGPNCLKRFINRFYILLPFFQNEESLLGYEESYFKQINMSVIPYAINAKGHDQLYEVIETWKKEMTEEKKGDEFYKFSEIIESNL